MIFRDPRVDARLEVAVLKNGKLEIHNFFCLNISITGMLIASNEKVKINEEDSIVVVIDPWKEHLKNIISCDVKVARLVESTSKGLEKYISYFGESKDISTILGVYYQDIQSESVQTINTFIHMLKAKSAA